MNVKRWIGYVFLLGSLLGCGGEPAARQPATTPTPGATSQPSATPAYTGVTVLADGVVQVSQPVLPLGFEISGKLAVVQVSPGDQVGAGDVLARLEEAESLDSYQAAVASAELSVLVAERSLGDLYTNAPLWQAEALQEIATARQALDALKVDIPIQQSAALQAVADAQEAVRTAEAQLNGLSAPASEAAITAAQADVTLAAQRLEHAEKAYAPYRDKPDNNLNKAYFGGAWADAKSVYDAAVRRLNALTGSASELTVAGKEAELAVARAQLAQARADYAALADGIPPADLAVAEARLTTAQAAYDTLQDGIDPGELDLAEAELANANIQLTVARNDLEKAVEAQEHINLVAPWSGTVWSVEVSPGVQVQAGAPIVKLLDTTRFEFHTTNLSERDLSNISPGQTAVVTLKAYPDQPVEAAVVRVGWQVGELVGDAATFPVVFRLDKTDLNIRPGMTGSVEIRAGQTP